MIETIISENKYGKYCLPVIAKHRPASKKILNKSIYEPYTIEFMIENCKDDIIHAGTFFGDFLPALSKNCPGTVWAFEPSIENFYCATETCKLNNLKNVKLFNGALGNNHKMLNLSYEKNEKFRGGNCQIVSEAIDKSYKVKQYIIDEIIPMNKNISIIQLDVEKYEKYALLGSIKTIKRCKPIIIIESDCNDLLISLSYKFYKKIHNNFVYVYKNTIE